MTLFILGISALTVLVILLTALGLGRLLQEAMDSYPVAGQMPGQMDQTDKE